MDMPDLFAAINMEQSSSMIPMQIMIRPANWPAVASASNRADAPTFQRPRQRHFFFGMSETRIEADRIKSISRFERMRETCESTTGNRMFTRNAIKRERLFPHNKTTLPDVIKGMVESGELLLYASDNRGDVYVFADAENP